MLTAELELLIAGVVICLVGVAVRQIAVGRVEARRNEQYEHLLDRCMNDLRIPPNMELMRICQFLFLLRNTGDDRTRLLRFRNAIPQHPFLGHCEEDCLLDLLTDTDPRSERFRLLREIRLWIEEMSTEEWFRNTKAKD